MANNLFTQRLSAGFGAFQQGFNAPGSLATNATAGDIAGAIASKTVSAAASAAADSTASGSGLDVGRIVAIVLGLIAIAAGLMMFRNVRETIVTTGKAAASAA